MHRQQLLARIKQIVIADYPSSEIILFGSRSRGDHSESCDWDILILIDADVTETEKIVLHNKIFTIELETGELLNVIIHTKQEWHNPFMQATPFYERVVKEGVMI